MKILIDMGHPAHVHLFKNFIWEMQKRGHEFKITARDKDVTKQLLDAYQIPYEVIGKPLAGKFSLLREWIFRTYRIIKIGKRFNADIYIGVLNPATAFSAWMNHKISVTFNDTEHAKFAKKITFPFTDCILTPTCYLENIGKKQIRYDSFHELAYLHPNYFVPNPSILDEIGLKVNDPFIILRFVSWGASHDVGQHGILDKIRLVKTLEPYSRVLITSEGKLPLELQPYQILVSPDKLHDLLYYTMLYMGEGGTMASEAALLGTPSIFVSTLVGSMGNFIELENTNDLLYSYTDSNAAQVRALEILRDSSSKEKWRIKRERLLKDKIDVTAFMVWFIENYPQSVEEVKVHPDMQYKFGKKCTNTPKTDMQNTSMLSDQLG